MVQNLGSKVLCSFIVALALVLLAIDLWFSSIDRRYSQLVENYECGYGGKPCEPDFNGDGRPGRLEIKYRHDAPSELPPEVIDGTQELLRLHAFSMDNTARTHVAVKNEAGKARLLIWEGIQRKDPPASPVAIVYGFDGTGLFEVHSSNDDRAILAAMAARDDSGTWPEWVVFRLLVWPTRFGYVVLLLVGFLIYRKRIRPPLGLRV